MHDQPFPQSHDASGNVQTEVEFLRETIKHLETERDEYRAALVKLLRAQIKEEDVVLPDPQDCLTFDQFVHELEEMVHRSELGMEK
jgi:hypothetical protein